MERKKTKIIAVCILLIAIVCLGIGASKALSSKGTKDTKESKKTAEKSTENSTEKATEKSKENKSYEFKPSNCSIDLSSNEWTIILSNKYAGQNTISFAGKLPEDIQTIIKMALDDKNIVYSSEDHKDFYENNSIDFKKPNKIFDHIQENVSQFESLRNKIPQTVFIISNTNENIAYMGSNLWSYANTKDNTIKIFSTEHMEYPSYPSIAIISKLCLSTAVADSEARHGNISTQYTSFTDEDVNTIYNSTKITTDKIDLFESLEQQETLVDSMNEIFCIYRNPDSYIRIHTLRATKSGKTGYLYEKKDYSHKEDFLINYYNYIRLDDEAYSKGYRSDKFEKATEFKNSMLKDGKSFYDYFIKNYKFCYSFNASVDNDSSTIQVYNMDNSYVSLVVDSTGKMKHAWLSDDKGIVLIVDINLNTNKNPDTEFNMLTSYYKQAKNGVDIEQSRSESKEPVTSKDEEGIGDVVPQSDLVKDLIEQIKNNKPITFDYTAKSDSADEIIYNTSDGTNTYAKTETPSIERYTTIIVYDNIKYTACPEPNDDEIFSKENVTAGEPAYKHMLLPEPLEDPDNLKYIGAYKTSVGVSEYWSYKDKRIEFNIIDSKLHSISFRTFAGKDLDCIIDNYKKEATSSLLKKPENVK